MTLKSVYDFLNDDINNIDLQISSIEDSIKEKNISIDEANVFIDELKNGNDDDSLFSPLYREQKRNENLSHEEETIVKCQAQVRELSLQLSSLISKKDNLKKQVSVIEKFSKTKTVIPLDTLNLLKENNEYVASEMAILMKNFNKCMESFIYVDPKRVIIEYKTFQDRVAALQARIDSNNKMIEKLSKNK